MRTALIDGDAIAYILGWNLRTEHEVENQGLMLYSIDNFLRTTFELLDATHYVGALSDKKVFRHQVYKFAPYKGNRKETHPDIERWKPIVYDHLRQAWGFIMVPFLEADDIVAHMSFKEELGESIICSPDKDLRQVPGRLYNYDTGVMETITKEEAEKVFTTLMVCGDVSDNIKGVPGLGPDKLKKKLQEGKSVYQMYVDYFGKHYGTVIHEETLCTVMPMTPTHPMISFFARQLSEVNPLPIVKKVPAEL